MIKVIKFTKAKFQWNSQTGFKLKKKHYNTSLPTVIGAHTPRCTEEDILHTHQSQNILPSLNTTPKADSGPTTNSSSSTSSSKSASTDSSSSSLNETHLSIYGSLVQDFKLKTKKGKTQLKFERTLEELQDFVKLVLDLQGTWKKGIKEKNLYVFQSKKSMVTLSWWSSTSTLTVAGKKEGDLKRKIHCLICLTTHKVQNLFPNQEVLEKKIWYLTSTKLLHRRQRGLWNPKYGFHSAR